MPSSTCATASDHARTNLATTPPRDPHPIELHVEAQIGSWPLGRALEDVDRDGHEVLVGTDESCLHSRLRFAVAPLSGPRQCIKRAQHQPGGRIGGAELAHSNLSDQGAMDVPGASPPSPIPIPACSLSS
jgi:hypothetical protein